LRSVIATVGVFIFFEGTPDFAVGVCEVHFILGSTLFPGAGPGAIGLAMGLLGDLQRGIWRKEPCRHRQLRGGLHGCRPDRALGRPHFPCG
jgi:hypothetical protein